MTVDTILQFDSATSSKKTLKVVCILYFKHEQKHINTE